MSSSPRSCLFSAPSTCSWRDLLAQRVALLLELVALVLGVQGRAEPPEEVAEGLDDAVGALLDRSEHLHRTALDAVQAAGAGFAEVGGEQDQRERDEDGQDRPASPHRFVVHAESVSKMVAFVIAWAAGCSRVVVAVRAVDRLELLQRAPGADRDTRQRRLGAMGGHLRLLAQPLVDPLQQRAAAGEHDAAVHDVRRQLGRSAVERLLDGVDDLHERLLERGANLLGGEYHGLR